MRDKIIVADADVKVAEVIGTTLEAGGMKTITVIESRDIMPALVRGRADLLILDPSMLGDGGYELCGALRAHARTRLLPVIMTSPALDPEWEIAALEAGADRCLAKPLKPSLLASTVRALLRRARLERGASPLTGLPGNNEIQREIESRLDEKRSFWANYVDIRHFKAFNDSRGFAEGDRMIQATADFLLDRCEETGMVGHLGGDDFVLIQESALPSDALRQEFQLMAENRFECAGDISIGNLHCPSGRFATYEAVSWFCSRERQRNKSRLTGAAATA